ncbi:unnamed protein product [Cuscuta campestris]|uniref:Reverse transcriptase domain-containing protein n=1 Tax=Cuscuta campestris TaxID=132261 RepID=A0A484L5D3_9ASTE|nr:unnamed protein product [Cuscuta campestris]
MKEWILSGDWWWSDSVRSKVEAKKVAYLRYMGCNVEEERAVLRVEYKKARKEAKLEVTRAKNAAFERLYKDIEEKGSVNPRFRLAKVSERKARDLDHMRCMKGSDGRVLVETAKVAKRWGEYFSELLNAGGDQRLVLDELGQSGVSRVYFRRICLEKVVRALRGMRSGRALGPDEIPVEFWKHAGRGAWVWLTKLFNVILRTARMPDEWRESLLVPLFKGKVPIVYTRVIKDIYDGAMTRVRTSGGDSESFSVGMGLHQDDIVLIDDTREGLNDKLELWCLALETKGFKISRNKTEYMECRFSGWKTESEVEVRIDSHLVPKVDRFRYLGSVIQADGELDGNVGHRVGVAWAKWRLASGVLCDPKISSGMKGKFYRSVVRPAMINGAECWAVKKTHVRRLHAAEMRMLRWKCGKTRLDRISNKVIQRQVGMAPVEDKLREARLRWFGHVRRWDANAPVRRCERITVIGGTHCPTMLHRRSPSHDGQAHSYIFVLLQLSCSHAYLLLGLQVTKYSSCSLLVLFHLLDILDSMEAGSSPAQPAIEGNQREQITLGFGLDIVKGKKLLQSASSLNLWGFCCYRDEINDFLIS